MKKETKSEKKEKEKGKVEEGNQKKKLWGRGAGKEKNEGKEEKEGRSQIKERKRKRKKRKNGGAKQEKRFQTFQIKDHSLIFDFFWGQDKTTFPLNSAHPWVTCKMNPDEKKINLQISIYNYKS